MEMAIAFSISLSHHNFGLYEIEVTAILPLSLLPKNCPNINIYPRYPNSSPDHRTHLFQH
jgi:hypothetical protein